MSGGIAYVYNPNKTLEGRANASMIDFDPMDKASVSELFELTKKHYRYTGSKIAGQILNNWDEEILCFVKVMPKALKEVLAAQDKQHLKAI
jgi:glutamate synthase (NADPH/NADH) large chain